MRTFWLSFRIGDSKDRSAYDDRYGNLLRLIEGYGGRVWASPTSLLVFTEDVYDLREIADHVAQILDLSKDVAVLGEVGSQHAAVIPLSKAGEAASLLKLVN